MRLQSLRVIHLSKCAAEKTGFDLASFDARSLAPCAFLLASCQRWIWVGDEAAFSGCSFPQGAPLEQFEGEDAYNFLLRVATGLESQVVGETDIFGQVKEAWQKNDSCPVAMRNALSPWMQRLFEDTKEIRSRYLQNLGGGASYGTLVRKLIRDSKQGLSGPILIIGSGQIARSVAPYLQENELWIWNRTAENIPALLQELPHAKTKIIASEADKAEAWRKAAHVVICVPIDNERDFLRLQLWEQNPNRGTVIHLGGYRNQCPVWSQVPGFYALDQLFELQKSRGDVRSVQISRAARGCTERSKLRAMGTSVSIPHGWEDLAAFA